MPPSSSNSSSSKSPSTSASFAIDLEDEVVRGSIVLQDGNLLWPPPKKDIPLPSPSEVKAKEAKDVAAKEKAASKEITPFQKASREVGLVGAGMGGMLALGA